jgi:histone deacetylase 6
MDEDHSMTDAARDHHMAGDGPSLAAVRPPAGGPPSGASSVAGADVGVDADMDVADVPELANGAISDSLGGGALGGGINGGLGGGGVNGAVVVNGEVIDGVTATGALDVGGSGGSGDDDMDDSPDADALAGTEPSDADVELPPHRLPSGCYYDDRMRYHVHPDMSTQSAHPEDPRRIQEIWNAFVRAGLVFAGSAQRLAEIETVTPNRFMRRIPTRLATAAEVTTVHSPAHYDWVMALGDISEAELRRMSGQMDNGRQSVYVSGLSWMAASISAAGAIEVCRQVVAEHARNAFAIVRPPGHHAERDHAMGFCLFNNVPIAVRTVQQEFPEKCRKVLILDWDVHHGNGVQNMFYNDASVLYISLHVWQDGRFYPGMPDNPDEPNAGIDCVGAGNGAGFNVNIAWHDQGMGDGEYMAAFQKIVMPIASEFDPDLVVISAGFDAAQGDELGGCEVTPACYAHMTHMLMGLADGKVAVCLEGGYNLEAISKSAVAVAKTLMGHPPPRLRNGLPRVNRDAAAILAKVQATHAPYWSCMRSGVLDVASVIDLKGARLHDVLRDRQVATMRDKHLMVPLYVHRDDLYRSYENQIMVSPLLSTKKTVVVILHDP